MPVQMRNENNAGTQNGHYEMTDRILWKMAGLSDASPEPGALYRMPDSGINTRYESYVSTYWNESQRN